MTESENISTGFGPSGSTVPVLMGPDKRESTIGGKKLNTETWLRTNGATLLMRALQCLWKQYLPGIALV